MRALASSPDAPLWDRRALQHSVAAMLLGVALVIGGFLAVLGDGTFNDQIGPLNLAVLGSVLAAAGQGGWLLHGRRALGRRRLVVRQRLESHVVRHGADEAPVDGRALVTVAGASRRHRADCLLVAGKVTLATGRGGDLVDCEVCRP
jgi:hypothetical protein